MPPVGSDAAPQSRRQTGRLVAAGAAAVQSENIGPAIEDATVTAASITFDAAVVGNNTNTRTINLVNKAQDGTGTAVIASLALVTGTNPAANDEVAMTLSGTPANLAVAAGDVLALVETVAGTGLANPGAAALVTLARR